LVGIPPAPRGVPKIEVTFNIDANGILTVAAKDLGTGKEQSVNVMPTSGLSEADISRIVYEAEASQEADKERREAVNVQNRARSLLYTSERALSEFGEVLEEADRQLLETDIEECKALLEEGSLDDVRAAYERLEASAQRIGEILYQVAGDDESPDADAGGEG
jgi:molecular chaperone DnaK